MKPNDEYVECTLEQATEFAKRRNYHSTNTTNPIDFPLVDELEEYRKQAQEMWSDSCTTPRKPNETV